MTANDRRIQPFLGVFLVSLPCFAVQAASVDGRLLSINNELRTIVLAVGETWNLGEFVTLDGLEPGQVVRFSTHQSSQ